jgi:adenylate kinase
VVRPVALTGTPGTGKSAVAAILARRQRVIEVDALARGLGASRGRGRTVEVDLARLRRGRATLRALGRFDVVVGHLAHLLPIRDVIVLRCRPVELERRLRRARRGSPRDRKENYVAEATDVVLLEAVRPGARVWEIDTTGRTVSAVARAVDHRIRHRGRSSYGAVDWLGDPGVTAHLLDRPR